jgi:hypothetical protein
MTQVPAGEAITFAWRPPANADETNLSHYKIQVDDGGTALIPAVEGQNTIVLGPFGIGFHTFTVRACNSFGCGDVASLEFETTAVVPGASRNLQAPGTPVSEEQAYAIAQGYAFIFRLNYLSAAELAALAARYSGPMTREGVLTFLDNEFLS